MVMRFVLAPACLSWACLLALAPGLPAGAEEGDLPPLTQVAKAGEAGWMVDRRMGCWLWNPEPRANETVSWTGDCGADGRAEGHGVREWRSPNGGTSRYAGPMLEGREHGRGAWTGPAGETYVGEYRDGRFHGKGVLTKADGTRIDGDWVDGRLQGRARATWPSGAAYEGEYREGLFHGFGTFTRADGRRLRGEWRWGHLNGRASITWPGGSRFEGDFADGLPNGRGVYADAEAGKRFSGEWAAGCFRGPGGAAVGRGRRECE